MCFSWQAPLERFELPTPGFEVRRSIQAELQRDIDRPYVPKHAVPVRGRCWT